MARAGHRYPLLVYRHVVSRWWLAIILIGLGLFALAYYERYIDPMGPFLPWRWQLAAAVGGLTIMGGIFFWVIRYFAYVQPYPTYLKLVTPFMRINISYKRIKKTTATEMRYLFAFKGLSGAARDIFELLATKTALVIDLNGYPISPSLLRLFLYRFFFKDKTPHLVILVQDWMRFSSELESMRSGVDPNPPAQKKRSRDSILARLPRK
ncbi:MAG: hypothetical protein EHM33_28125 [Chloroflexi bacterium]|nr:MAG: hypothetical protein EHM33_28125 [Chloroflexota bacterium]